MRRVATAVVGATVLLLVASPAVADPATPTNFKSTVTAVDADPDARQAFEIDILGGDAFVVVRARPGTVIAVPGYEAEPYLRFNADGTVEVNERSPARWLNDARYGAADVDVPASASADAPPLWTSVAADGEYAWHDHRIHFMSPRLPPHVDPSARNAQHVFDWELPLVVDGADVRVLGQLAWHPGPRPGTVAAFVVAAVVGGIALGMRVAGSVAGVVAVAALIAAAASLTMVLGQPPGAEGDVMLVVLPVAAFACAMLPWLARSRAARQIGSLAWIPLAVWVVLLAGALARPVVPGPLLPAVLRGALGLGLAAALAQLTSSVQGWRRAAPSGSREG